MAKTNASRYLDQIFPGLSRDWNGDVQVTADGTIGMVPPGSILNSEVKDRLDKKAQRRANDLLNAAEEHRLRGRELEARILANQAEFEVVARDMRQLDFGKEHEAKRAELQRLTAEARLLDAYLVEREQRDRASWDEERAAREAAQDAEDAVRRTIATEHVSAYKDSAVAARLEASRQANPDLDSDSTERIDTRLARGDDGSLQSNYLANSRADAARRMSVNDYIASLRTEAAVANNPSAKARYERQADFELEHSMLSSGQTHSPEMSRLQLEQARADSHSSSSFNDSVQPRAERYKAELASAAERGQVVHNSQFRQALAPSMQKTYDEELEKHTSNLQGEQGADHTMTAADVQHFEDGFKSGITENLAERAGLQAAPQANAGSITSTEVSTDEHDLSVREVEGYKGELAQDKKSIVYSDVKTQDQAFKDEGARVRLVNNSRGASDRLDDIRAATKLAAEKYSRFSISGTDEFRITAAKVAGEMGYADRLSNPTLREIAKQEQERMNSLRAQPSSSLNERSAVQASVQSATQQLEDAEEQLPSAGQAKSQAQGGGASELPWARHPGHASGGQVKSQAQGGASELPWAKYPGYASRPEVETAASTKSGDLELPSPRQSNARQTLQGLDAEQAASDDLPRARSHDLTLEANPESQGMSQQL